MATLIVVDDPGSWPLSIPGVRLITARSYLTDPQYSGLRAAKVFNLCRSYRYQSLGYYVSLLATARGHKPLPSITTIQDLKSQSIVRVASDELDGLIQKSLAHIQAREFVLSIYFGQNVAKRYERLSQHLFKLFPAPFLRANLTFSLKTGKWRLQNVGPIAASDIPEGHRPFVAEMAQEYFVKKRQGWIKNKRDARYDLAILVAPEEPEPPSDEKALRRFARAAQAVGLAPEFIREEDIGRLAEFDALFIRETTNVNHHTYRFTRRAVSEGLVVVDDPESILKCTNKVFLAELLERNRIATPRTLIVHRDNIDSVPQLLGFPCILKEPDSSFSRGVIKVDNKRDFSEEAARILEKSEMIIAQEFLLTPFDWRIGIIDRVPLYACKYHMAGRHWQIIERDPDGAMRKEGKFEVMPVEHAPTKVVGMALRAANLIGDSLYGVDLKQVGNKVYIIEINDNPSIDAGVEDRVLKGELYLRIMRVILRRIEKRKQPVGT